MNNDTYFFTYCLIFGTLLGFFWRLFVKGEAREKFYLQLSGLALRVLLPFHIAGTYMKLSASSKIEFGLVFIVGGIVCCIAILTFARVALSGSRRALLPHYPYIASTFAGGGRAIVLLAAASPFVDTLLAEVMDPRLHGRGGMLDALAIFDAGYWVFFTTIVYGLFMEKSFARGRRLDTLEDFSRSTLFIIVIAPPFVAAVFQEQIVSALGIGMIDFLRLLLAAVTSIFASAAVALVAEFRLSLSSIRGIGVILLLRFVALTLVALAVFATVPAYLSLLWLPMTVMLLAPPSSFIPQMLYISGSTEAQRDEAAALNLSWNMVLYVFIAGLVAASLLTANQ